MPDRDEIITALKEMLSDKRLRHSLNVEKRAAYLAGIHGADREKAALAGLVHDICHDMPKDAQLKYIRSHGILLDIFTVSHPALWHAVCAADYIRGIGITDDGVIAAVRYHTTGRRGMSVLEKIVYLADATSAERDYPVAGEMRELAEESLDAAMLKSLSRELTKLIENKKTITADAWEAYNDFARGGNKYLYNGEDI